MRIVRLLVFRDGERKMVKWVEDVGASDIYNPAGSPDMRVAKTNMRGADYE